MQENQAMFRANPHTADILEVMRRWEDVRAKNWLTDAQKEMLKDKTQEHTLLINEQELGGKSIAFDSGDDGIPIPLAGRSYLSTTLPMDTLLKAFEKAQLLP